MGSRLPRRSPGLLFWAALAALLGNIPATPTWAADAYHLGHGLDVGPFNVAGYGNVLFDAPTHDKKALVLDDLSLFVSGHIGRFFNPFVEAELTRFDFLRQGGGRRNGDFVLERLYNDVNFNDSWTFRVGKMLAPVGEWNEIHAAPLVLSTVRPAVTYRSFSEYVTGLSVLYSDPFAQFPDVQVYWQPNGELAERPSDLTVHQYDTVEGVHVSLPFGLRDKVGASYQHAKNDEGINQSAFGLDFSYRLGDLALQGEATVSDIANPAAVNARDTEWGLYAAASYALSDKWSVYSWYEAFADRTKPSLAQDAVVGVSYRLRPESIFRLEYLQNFDEATVNPTGVFASWSILF